MDNGHVALILNRLDSIDDTLATDRQTSAASRLRTYEKIEETSAKVTHVENRVSQMESTILTISPTVAEFVLYKAQVQGAGKLGRTLWKIGGWVLGLAVAATGAWGAITAVFNALTHR